MVASVGEQNITAYDYLLIWMGALGKFVGLDVPMSLLDTSQNKDES
jgi:ubiquitin-like-conjugating enzyme ATG10